MDKAQECSGLYARLDDLLERAEKGEVGVSHFLSPRECFFAEKFLSSPRAHFLLYGGYEDAERRRVYILPEYMDGVKSISDMKDFGFDADISALRVIPSGYRALTHRDYLGSLLGLGLERAVIGDILVDDAGGATVLCTSEISVFLLAEFSKVANDRVKVRESSLDGLCIPPRRFAEIMDTVASPRIDCVVGALCSLSRDKAKQAVEAGIVEVDFLCEQRPDRVVFEGVLISVRGYGRYRVLSLSDKTKKGRYRLLAQKFI